MKDFLHYLISLLVDHPDAVVIDEHQGGEYVTQYTISAHQDDIGKIIGKEGKIIQAIRNVAKILSTKEGTITRIEIGQQFSASSV